MESSHLVIVSTSGKFNTKFNVLRCISFKSNTILVRGQRSTTSHLKVVNVALKCKTLLAKSMLCLSLIVSTKQNGSTWLGTSLVVFWENFTSRGFFSGVISNRMPGRLPRTISLLLQLLRTSRMCLSRSWGSFWR